VDGRRGSGLFARTSRIPGRVLALLRRPGHRQVASAALIVAFATLLAKVAAAAKEVVVAKHFGTADQVDAFLLAWLAPSLVLSVVANSFTYAFLPVYTDVRQRGGKAAGQALLGSATAMAFGGLGAIGLLLAVVVPLVLPWVAGGFDAPKIRLATHLFWLALPVLVLSAATSTWTAVLNAHGRFARAATASIAIPVMAILGLVAFGDRLGIHALALGTVAGYLVEAALVASAVRGEGYSIRPRWTGMENGARRILAQFGPAASAMIFTAVNPVIDQVMGAQLAPGSMASLGYGNKLVAFGVGIGYGSIATAVLPHFSRLHAAGDWKEMERSIRFYALLIGAVAVPVTIGMIALSEPIVRLLFQRGAFTSADTALVARIQAFYLGQIPFVMVSVLFNRFLVATGQNRVLLRVSVAAAILNVTANYALLKLLGVAGIALSTTLVYALTCTLNFRYFRRRMRDLLASPRPAFAPEILAGAPQALGD
jgi:putative peptidoglycan lipid II flippase